MSDGLATSLPAVGATTMTLHAETASVAPPGESALLDVPFLAVTSLTFLKPRLKRTLKPIAVKLAGIGVTANQVTSISLAGSIAVGWVLCTHPGRPVLFALLPFWLLVRTACATIDGTLAVEFGQKSRLGGVLNEAGDIVSDIALVLPFAFIAPFSIGPIVFLIILVVLSEISGLIGPCLGASRRLEGPMGKADRSIVLAIMGAVIAMFNELPQAVQILVPLVSIGLILTIWNRLRFATAEARNTVGSR